MLYEVITELSKNEYQGACYNYMSHTRKQELTPEDKFIVANQLVDTYLLLTEGKKGNYFPEDADVESNFTNVITSYSIHYTKLYDQNIFFPGHRWCGSHASA